MTADCRLRLRERVLQREGESRAGIGPALRPDAAAVAGDDPTNRRQPDARAFKLVGSMQPLKHSEEVVGILHVEPNAVVADVHNETSLLFTSATHFDFGRIASSRVLHRVAEEVRKNL